MSAKVITTVSKKIPIVGLDFSSVSASCTVEAEIVDLAQVAEQVRALYAQAEAAVDEQLRLAAPAAPNVLVTPPSAAPTSQPRQASQPYRPAQQRRAPAPITDSQLRFLDRLIAQTGTSLPAILEHHHVGNLRDISCKDAAGLIDELKARVPA